MSSNLIDRTMDWGIAKLVKASDSESDMRRFESYYPSQKNKYIPIESMIRKYQEEY